MIRFLFIFALTLALPTQAALQQSVFRLEAPKLSSPFFDFKTEWTPFEHGAPDFLRPILTNSSLKYVPIGEQKIFSGTCQWKNRKASGASQSQIFEQKWQDYIRDCSSVIQNGTTSFLGNFYFHMMIESDFASNPHFLPLTIRFAHGSTTRAWLALRDLKPRPLVVIRPGIFSSLDLLQAERSVIIQFFEQSPFHVLILESRSSPDSVSRNDQLTFAGLDEGVENLQVLKHLRDPKEPLSKLASDLHFVGLSLAGAGAYWTHVLQEIQQDGPWLSSTLLLCPPLDLKATLDSHLSNSFRNYFLNAWARKRLNSLLKKNPEWNKDQFLGHLFQKLESEYKGPKEDESWIQWPEETKEKRYQFWPAQDFSALIRPSKTPLYILASKKDPIVPFEINSGKWQTKLASESGIHLWPLEESYHCSIAGAYDWREMTSVFQDLILSHTQNYQPQIRDQSFALSTEALQKIQQNGFFPRLQFLVDSGNFDAVTVRIQFLPQKPTWFGQEFFEPQYDFELKRKFFTMNQELLSPAEVLMLQRWLAQNFETQMHEQNKIKFSWPDWN